ncbi:rhodanese-like domain-containing protein [uncultured Ornithinimicrobium sp.]|uniref:rhodanese-like domain-containing protein n=1 Tax=uncultured Ornithinimicrobium sp. TaxID=259307 RepID=UPI002592A671|nr:rhodanese-like domain-containing protein [uncultured Ornithinimicrobium sp.]
MSEIPTVTVSELPDDVLMVDVREPDEWAAGHAPSAVHIPMGDVPARLDELPVTDASLAVVCRSGGRSGRAVQWLVQQGFDVMNVEGGMQSWARSGKPLASENGQAPEIL